MGLSDKLKDIRKQAQGAVAEHKDGLQNAVGAVGSAANQRTNGKYADRIGRLGGKLNDTVEKFSGDEGDGGDAPGPEQSGSASTEASPASTEATPASSEATPAGTEASPAGEPPAFE